MQYSREEFSIHATENMPYILERVFHDMQKIENQLSTPRKVNPKIAAES
jgi:hypothetical protein